MTRTQKIKIAKTGNLIFLSIQPIPYLSCKFENFWKKIGNFEQKKNQHFFSRKFSKLHERSGIGWIERKTKFPVFAIFIFLVLVIFFTQNDPNFQWIFTHNSKNKNRRIFLLFFPYYTAHPGSFIKFPLHILEWEEAVLF